MTDRPPVTSFDPAFRDQAPTVAVPDLTALVGSRLCHDLISPIGAIGNGVELMLMDLAEGSPELALVAESVAHANARIRFFRVAFGATGGPDQTITRGDVSGALSDMVKSGRLRVLWDSPASLSRREAKLACLGFLCLETALPQGGLVKVERGEARWTLTASGPKLRVEAALWEYLSNPMARTEVTPATVQFALLREEMARQHRRLTVEIGAPQIRMTF